MNAEKKRFDKISKDIKEVRIQGATNIAKQGLKAYFMLPKKSSKKKLLSLRETEPMLERVLNEADKKSQKEILQHFDFSQKKINELVLKLIKNNDVIFTHCHSSTVSKALINAKNKGKKFEVYNTETRPLFQGRKTARELKNAGIKTTLFVDSAAMIALTKKQGTKKVDKIFIGADALTKKGIVNKVGSGMIARIAKDNKVPIYIISDSWKFTKKKILMEQRSLDEIWKNAPQGLKLKNPAFEFVPKKYIKKIITELGIMSYDNFLKKVKC